MLFKCCFVFFPCFLFFKVFLFFFKVCSVFFEEKILVVFFKF